MHLPFTLAGLFCFFFSLSLLLLVQRVYAVHAHLIICLSHLLILPLVSNSVIGGKLLSGLVAVTSHLPVYHVSRACICHF